MTSRFETATITKGDVAALMARQRNLEMTTEQAMMKFFTEELRKADTKIKRLEAKVKRLEATRSK